MNALCLFFPPMRLDIQIVKKYQREIFFLWKTTNTIVTKTALYIRLPSCVYAFNFKQCHKMYHNRC